ncbi:hypothetical protein [Candidatus Pelagibacter sp. HIMB1623]|uniref:hypothetical protein n=1 Tax=Candidatus Pelagibacter sp. HIMB1623 TaxID=3413358 RepID=UPI003F856AE9
MLDKITRETIEGTKSAKDFTIKKWKKFIRKRALKRVEKLMAYAQKKPEDYTKEEMRKLIEKEEKEVISTLTATVGIGVVLTMLGIPKL